MREVLMDDETIEQLAASIPAKRVRDHWVDMDLPTEYAAMLGLMEAADEIYDSDLASSADAKIREWAAKEVAAAVVTTYGGIELEMGWRGIVVKSELFADLTAWEGGPGKGAWYAFTWEDLFLSTIYGTDLEDPESATAECNSAPLAREISKSLRDLADRMDRSAEAIEAKIR